MQEKKNHIDDNDVQIDDFKKQEKLYIENSDNINENADEFNSASNLQNKQNIKYEVNNKKNNNKFFCKNRTIKLAMTAVFMALVIVFTSFVKIPIGVGGYLHLGDIVIYLCSSILPLPYALLASCVGAALSDVISGYAIWAPFTLVIKALLVLCFSSKGEKVITKRNIIANAFCLVITVMGYFFAEVIIYGNWLAYLTMPWNLLQAGVATAGYLIVGFAFDKVKVKQFMLKR